MNHFRVVVILTVAIIGLYVASYIYSAQPSTRDGVATVLAGNATASAVAKQTATARANTR